MLPANRPPVKPGNEGLRPESGPAAFDRLFAPADRVGVANVADNRMAAFARLVEAGDRTNVKQMLAATRELRALGYSVVVLDPNTKGAAR